jgi:hypothetical protein
MDEPQEQTQVAVRINETNLLKNLRYAFSNRYTIVSELMQNARRAGASYVAVDYDAAAQTLMVRDDGCGIDDFQKLFTFGESGWDDTTVASETAFGLGFTKSLYTATLAPCCRKAARFRLIPPTHWRKHPLKLRPWRRVTKPRSFWAASNCTIWINASAIWFADFRSG